MGFLGLELYKTNSDFWFWNSSSFWEGELTLLVFCVSSIMFIFETTVVLLFIMFIVIPLPPLIIFWLSLCVLSFVIIFLAPVLDLLLEVSESMNDKALSILLELDECLLLLLATLSAQSPTSSSPWQ